MQLRLGGLAAELAFLVMYNMDMMYERYKHYECALNGCSGVSFTMLRWYGHWFRRISASPSGRGPSRHHWLFLTTEVNPCCPGILLYVDWIANPWTTRTGHMVDVRYTDTGPVTIHIAHEGQEQRWNKTQ